MAIFFRRLSQGATLAAVLLAPAAHAADDFGVELSAGGGTSDNVTRVSTDPIDETIATVGAKVSFDQRGTRVTSDVVADFAYYDYLDNTYDAELLGTFAGATSVALVQDRLKWFAADTFGQVLGDPFVPATPDNRDNLNYLTTGLESDFRFGAQTALNLGASYSIATYENLPFDSDTLSGDLSLTRSMSSASSFGVNVRASQIRYDNEAEAGSNYDATEGFLRYQAGGARTKLEVDGGYSQIDRDVGGKDSGLLFRINVAREISTHSSLLFNAGQEFSDSASAFAKQSSGGAIGLDSFAGRQAATPFTSRYSQLSWDISGARTAIALAAAWHEQKYDAQPLFDQNLTSIGASVRRSLSAALNVTLRAQYAKGAFQQVGGDYSETNTGVSLDWRFARTLSVNLSFDHTDRNGDTSIRDYQENRLWLMLNYRFGEVRSTMLRPEFSGDAGSGPAGNE